VGGLGADTDPVTRTLTVDVDQRRLLGGVVLADLLDDAAVALFARIGDHDAIERGPDLAEALQTDLDCHCGGLSCVLVGMDRCDVGWGIGVGTVRGHSRSVRGAVRGEYNGLFCQIFCLLPNNSCARWVTPATAGEFRGQARHTHAVRTSGTVAPTPRPRAPHTPPSPPAAARASAHRTSRPRSPGWRPRAASRCQWQRPPRA